jgi:hypothetical protein
MWSTDTIWFDAALVLGIFAVGNILFGHFEEHRPKWRRLLKVALVLGISLFLSATVGRLWMFVFLAIPSLGALYVHAWWLPKRGVNGWTGEPRDRYYEVIGHKIPRQTSQSSTKQS